MVDIRNVLVLVYIIVGYISAILLLLCDHGIVYSLIGTLLLTHTLLWSGYIHHELCHDSVFDQRKWNIRIGRLLDWINGACFWTFEELKKQHIKHHIYKVDYDITSDLLKWLSTNSIIQKVVLSCEYCYFPLHAYIIHWRSVVAPWWKDDRAHMRSRTILVIALRLIFFSALYYLRGVSILVCYLIASSITIQVGRFTDAFSHTYDIVPIDAPRKHLSKLYDMAHTYSIVYETDEQTSLLERLFARLIHVGIFLNFNFHNQHHYATQKKWYQLGASFLADESVKVHDLTENLTNENNAKDEKNNDEYIMNNQPNENESTAKRFEHDSLCGVPKTHFTIPLSTALRAFHLHRSKRVLGDPGKPVIDPVTNRISLDTFFGVIDASLLILEL